MIGKPYVFLLPGEPVAKGRPRVTKNGAYTPQKTVNYEALVVMAFVSAYPGHEPLAGSLRMEIDAYFKIPKSASQKAAEEMNLKRIRPTKRPDADNLGKIVGDALNGVAYRDDAQVVELVVKKYYSSVPGIRVGITEVESLRKAIQQPLQVD